MFNDYGRVKRKVFEQNPKFTANAIFCQGVH